MLKNSNIYLEVLKSKQREIFNKLDKFPEFYLVGGTGLALQMNHRISHDFDMFGDKLLDRNFIAKIYIVFKGHNIKFSLRHSEQMNLTVDSVKFNFVKYSYPLIFKLKKIDNVNVASIKEIALMKSSTLGSRASLKDYVDLYFILKKKKITIEDIIEGCKKKYKTEFNDRLFLEELTYIRDIKGTKIEFLKKKVDKIEIERFFEEEIKKLNWDDV
jgi:hypothetical protein